MDFMDKIEQNKIDLQRRRAIRDQLKKTLEIYKHPEKTPPKLSQSIQDLYAAEKQKIEAQRLALEAERIRLEQSRREPSKPKKPRNPNIKIAEPPTKRKIMLSSSE